MKASAGALVVQVEVARRGRFCGLKVASAWLAAALHPIHRTALTACWLADSDLVLISTWLPEASHLVRGKELRSSPARRVLDEEVVRDDGIVYVHIVVVGGLLRERASSSLWPLAVSASLQLVPACSAPDPEFLLVDRGISAGDVHLLRLSGLDRLCCFLAAVPRRDVPNSCF